MHLVHSYYSFHIRLYAGFLLLSGWAWAVICAPDIFSWNFSFMLINTIQTLFILYRVRPVKFSPELEEVYSALFQPLKVPRSVRPAAPSYLIIVRWPSAWHTSVVCFGRYEAFLRSSFGRIKRWYLSCRHVFKKLVAPECCSVLSLGQGEYYAKQENTRTDRLGLLIHGRYISLYLSAFLLHLNPFFYLRIPV